MYDSDCSVLPPNCGLRFDVSVALVATTLLLAIFHAVLFIKMDSITYPTIDMFRLRSAAFELGPL